MARIAVVALDRTPLFHLSVPCEVLGADRSDMGLPRHEVLVVRAERGPLRSSSGVALQTPHGLDVLDEVDIVIVPWWGHHDDELPARLLGALRRAHDRGARIAGLCGGAFVLAAAGLLDGRRATTHWMYADKLAARYPLVRVEPKVLYVDEGDVLTSAGTAAAIDLCLHLLRGLSGAEVANAVARRMVVPPHRSGGQRQFVETPLPSEPCEGLQDVMEWVAERLDEEHSIPSLARRAAMSERTFARRFTAEVGTTPHKWLTSQRVLRARHLLESTDLDVERIARESGFATAAVLRHHFQREIGIPPVAYRRAFTKQPASA